LPTGIWYSPGVKANVLFFDKRPATRGPATSEIWVYDLRSDRNFSLRQNPITSADLADFVSCYSSGNLVQRKEDARYRRFKYEEIVSRDKANLDIQWQTDIAGTTRVGTPQALMREILEDLEVAMREFSAAEKINQR
jgi:type I restriction enzyme M protein